MKSSLAELDAALDRLEAKAGPLMSRNAELEHQTRDSQSFKEDRARLAEELDKTKSEVQSLTETAAAREAQFQALADESKRELDSVITQVRSALGAN